MKLLLQYFLYPVTIAIILLSTNIGFAQKKVDLKETFLEAESYMLFEEYKEALPLYLELYKAYPNNDNYSFRIGQCYLNIPNEKEKAIFYLEKAVNNIDPKYKEGRFKESKAPMEAYYELGSAYRVNNKLDKASSTYKKFKKMLDPVVFNSTLVDDQIKCCEVAHELMENPVYVVEKNLGEQINSNFSETNPVVSADENVLVYTSKLKFYDAIFYSTKVNGEWSGPINLVPDLGVDGECYPTGISSDGKELFLYKSDEYQGNLYVSRFENGKWSKVKKLNDNINTKYWESHASVSPDGKTLYFTSNRKGGYGGLDIYKSTRTSTSNDNWGPAVNLGPSINTPYNEDTPFPTEDGKTIYFSSYGHLNMGGYDIFYSTLMDNNQWSVPLNVGYPINTTDDDMFFVPVKDGSIAYYSKYDKNGYGQNDIYRMEIFSGLHPRKYIIKGSLSFKDNIRIPNANIRVFLINASKSDTVASTKLDANNSYNFLALPGKYKIVIEGQGIKEKTEKLIIDKGNKESEILLNSLVEIDKKAIKKDSIWVSDPSLISIPTKIYNVTTGDELKIDLSLAKNSRLTLEIWHDSILLKTESYDISKKRFTYNYTPLVGKNIIRLKLQTNDHRIDNKDIIINYIPSENNKADVKSGKFSTDENLTAFVRKLASIAEGDLKKVLLGLDLQKSGITNVSDLIKYLKEQSKNNHYTDKDVDLLISALGSRIFLDKFLSDLTNLSTGNLKLALEKVNLDSLKIKTGFGLIQYLNTKAPEGKYTTGDVTNVLVQLASKGFGDTENFSKELQKLSEGRLQRAISEIDLKTTNISTIPLFVDYLLNNAQNKGYSKDDVLKSLVTLAMREELKEILITLREIADGSLKKALNNLNIDSAHINTFDDLVKYLIDHGPKYGYTKDDVMALILKLSLLQSEDVKGFLSSLSSFASGNLKRYLDNIDLNKERIGSVSELVELLKKQAKVNHYTEKDIIGLLGMMAFRGNVSDYLNEMRVLSSGNLRSTLNDINLEKNDIKSLEGLVKYLLSRSQKDGYSINDIKDLLLALKSERELEALLPSLRNNSSGDLRLLLKNTNIGQLRFTTTEQLVNYLKKQGAKNNYSTDDIINALSIEIAQTEMNLISGKMSVMAGDSLSTLLQNFDAHSEKISNPDELFDYLNAHASEYGYKPSEVQSLMVSINTQGLSPKDFQDALYSLASGNLKSAIKKLNLQKQGITTNKRLIQYLIAKSDKLYNEKEVIDLVLSYNKKKWFAGSLTKLTSLSSGKLKTAIEGYNTKILENNNIQQLVKYLVERSQSDGYSKDEILKLLLAYSNLLKLEDFHNHLIKLSDGYLKHALESIHVSDTAFNSESKLIDYLFAQTSSGKFTKAEVLNLLSKLIQHDDLQAFLRNLTRLASGNLKKFLMTINIDKLGIKTAQELIDYLLAQAATHGYTKEDVLKLLMKLAKEQMEFRQQTGTSEKRPFEPFIYAISFLLLVLVIAGIYYYLKKKKE
jgi:hypothetical protein